MTEATALTPPQEGTQLGRRKKAEPKKARKLCIICSKGSLDMAYPPLILANAARMSGIDAHLFFTFWGMDIITKSKMGNLHVATVGNPNMHPMFHIPTIIGGLPGMSSLASAMMRKEIANLDFPPVPEFLDMLHDAGAHIYACEMAMKMMKLKPQDLLDYAEVLGAMEFLEIAEDAQIIFV
ncbi:MAG: DsrE/DsrF/DrsH-like family protein [Aggregatilineales bacterium]